jgi:3-methylcrotonyl-CoA carboxylase alpha subunit
MPDDMRAAMGHAACEAARAIGYRGAGTVEFIADASDGLRSDRFYFMEMNTRLQVEHPVTEMITGQDLVDWQLRVAGGEPLPLKQDNIGINGHAFEVRLYAEDPAKSFFPSTGRLAAFRLPPESNAVRVDAGVREGDEISIYYDPMIAKLITWGDTRDDARRQMDAALRQVEVAGVRTNTSFLRQVIGHDVFAAGAMDTGFIDAHLDALVPADAGAPDEVLLLGAIAVAQSRLAASQTGSASDPYSPWNDVSGWRLSGTAEETIILIEGEESRELCVRYTQDGIETSWSGRAASAAAAGDGAGRVHALIDGHGTTAGVVHASNAITVMRVGESWTFALHDPLDVTGDDAAASGGVTAPMTGKITQVWVKAGDSVSRGAPLIALEAMKMEHTLSAPGDLKVSDVLAAVGDQVEGGAALVVFEDPAS